MALRFIFSIFVLMNCVSGLSVDDVDNCLSIIRKYKEEGFAEKDAKPKDLELAIDSITKAFWNSDSRMRKHDWVEDLTLNLTKCYEIRKVRKIF